MKTLFRFLLVLVAAFSISHSLICHAAAAETIVVNDDVSIDYETIVTDLNTGVEYRSKTGEPAIIEAALGHQYSVVTTASINGYSGIVTTKGHHLLGESGLTISYCFSEAGRSFTHSYTFILPEDTELSCIKKSMYSNSTDVDIFGSCWKQATGKEGIWTRMRDDRPVNDGYILEVSLIEPDKSWSPSDWIIFGVIIIAAIIGGVVSGSRYLKKRRYI